MLFKHLYLNPLILLKNSNIFRFQTKKKKKLYPCKIKNVVKEKKIANDCTTLNASMG